MHALRHRRHLVVLVVERDVVEDVLVLAVHPAQAVLDDDRHLVRERGIVGHDSSDTADASRWLWPSSCWSPSPMSVVRPAVAPIRKAAPAAVAERPDLVHGSLEAEHRIEDVERDRELAERGVRRSRCRERSHRSGLGDAFLEDLAVGALGVREEQLGVDRDVALAERRVDLEVLEEAFHAEGARLVRDDRHHATCRSPAPRSKSARNSLANERHRGRDLLGPDECRPANSLESGVIGR